MAQGGKFRVLVLDPVRQRRERIAQRLGLRYEVLEAGTPREALAAATAQPPDAVVATLRQIESNGLAACKELRAAAGPDAFLMVHGPVENGPTQRDKLQSVARGHRVDTWNPAVLSPSMVDVVVWNQLNQRRPRELAPRVSAWQRFTTMTVGEAWSWLRRAVGLG